eukprot:gene6220-7747_t
MLDETFEGIQLEGTPTPSYLKNGHVHTANAFETTTHQLVNGIHHFGNSISTGIQSIPPQVHIFKERIINKSYFILPDSRIDEEFFDEELELFESQQQQQQSSNDITHLSYEDYKKPIVGIKDNDTGIDSFNSPASRYRSFSSPAVQKLENLSHTIEGFFSKYINHKPHEDSIISSPTSDNNNNNNSDNRIDQEELKRMRSLSLSSYEQLKKIEAERGGFKSKLERLETIYQLEYQEELEKELENCNEKNHIILSQSSTESYKQLDIYLDKPPMNRSISNPLPIISPKIKPSSPSLTLSPPPSLCVTPTQNSPSCLSPQVPKRSNSSSMLSPSPPTRSFPRVLPSPIPQLNESSEIIEPSTTSTTSTTSPNKKPIVNNEDENNNCNNTTPTKKSIAQIQAQLNPIIGSNPMLKPQNKTIPLVKSSSFHSSGKDKESENNTNNCKSDSKKCNSANNSPKPQHKIVSSSKLSESSPSISINNNNNQPTVQKLIKSASNNNCKLPTSPLSSPVNGKKSKSPLSQSHSSGIQRQDSFQQELSQQIKLKRDQHEKNTKRDRYEKKLESLQTPEEEPSLNSEGSIKILFQFPSGKKVTRIFKDSQKVFSIKEYVEWLSMKEAILFGNQYKSQKECYKLVDQEFSYQILPTKIKISNFSTTFKDSGFTSKSSTVISITLI